MLDDVVGPVHAEGKRLPIERLLTHECIDDSVEFAVRHPIEMGGRGFRRERPRVVLDVGKKRRAIHLDDPVVARCVVSCHPGEEPEQREPQHQEVHEGVSQHLRHGCAP